MKKSNGIIAYTIIIAIVIALIFFFQRSLYTQTNVTYSQYRSFVEEEKIAQAQIEQNAKVPTGSVLFFVSGSSTEYRVFVSDVNAELDRLQDNGIKVTLTAVKENYFLNTLLPVLILVIGISFVFVAMTGRMAAPGGGSGGGQSMANFGRSRAVMETGGSKKVLFKDVAGLQEEKEELEEVVDFLKNPNMYTSLGARIPKGILLVGPPGTGKTLLARAVAGEAGVPFFRISGSDFVEMFVGVGASRVRDLFRSAREKAPCIIFIDELDAIGKSRVNNLGGNDEREQTLNQLLVEMDGFDNEKGLIILAATNRPDILDPALLRPGRFDRQIVVDKPDVKGREEILRLHAKNVKIDPSVDFSAVAHATSGFAGADLANIVNEAALLAVRAGRKVVLMDDFDEAIEKTLVGLKKKSRVVKENERKIVAYHETGHALVAAFTPGSDPVHKITIIPRGMGALGYTLQRSEDDQFLYSKKELMGQVDVLLGGRAAEQIIFGEISTGASNDISRATDIIKRMITDYGMSEKFKNVTLGKSGRGYGTQEPELVREFSEDTQKYVDDEIARVMEERYQFVLKTLKKHGNLLEYIAQRLLEKETMDGKEFQEIVKAEDHCNELESTAVKNSSEEKEKPKRARKPRAKKDVTEEK